MTNWCGLSRSNYFRVKDRAAFEAFVAQCRGITLLSNDSAEDPRFGVYDDEGGSWPDGFYDGDDEVEIDFFAELAKHLDNDVAVLMTAGFEGARFASGYALAINPAGECCEVSLTDIYAKALAQFGMQPTAAEY